jgi:hypothetical protein
MSFVILQIHHKANRWLSLGTNIKLKIQSKYSGSRTWQNGAYTAHQKLHHTIFLTLGTCVWGTPFSVVLSWT